MHRDICSLFFDQGGMTMKKIIGLVMTGALLLSSVSSIGVNKSKAQTNLPGNYASKQAVVMLKGDASEWGNNALKQFCKETDTKLNQVVSSKSDNKNGGAMVVSVSSNDLSTTKLINELKENEDVLIAEPNYKYKLVDKVCKSTSANSLSNESKKISPQGTSSYFMSNEEDKISNDSFVDNQWHLKNDGSNDKKENADISAKKGWDILKKYKSDKEAIVAVIDSGVNIENEDLKNMIWENPFSEDVLEGKNGLVIYGDDKAMHDYNGHGTHVAGIIASELNNEKGVAGVAGVKDAVKILPVSMTEADSSYRLIDLSNALSYVLKAKKLGVNIVSLNLSVSDIAQTRIISQLLNELTQNGVLIAAAAANDGKDVGKENAFPVSSDNKNIIGVAASNQNDELASFSNYGKGADIAAPGTNILSTCKSMGYETGIVSDEEYPEYFDLSEDDYTFEYVKCDEDTGEEIPFGECDNATATRDSKCFGINSIKSHKLVIKDAKEGEVYRLRMKSKKKLLKSDEPREIRYDVIPGPEMDKGVEDLTVSLKYYLNSQLDFVKDNIGILPTDNFWTRGEETVNSVEEDSSFDVEFDINVEEDGDYSLIIDNFSIFKPESEKSDYPHYVTMTGTSMATPVITGACTIAQIEAMAKGKDLEYARRKVLSSVRKTFENEYVVGSSGIFDFSKWDEINPFIDNCYREDNGNLVICGFNFGTEKNSVLIDTNSNDTNVVSWDDERIVLKPEAAEDNSVKVKVYNSYGNYCEGIYSFTKQKNAYKELGLLDTKIDEDIKLNCSDGRNIISISSENYDVVCMSTFAGKLETKVYGNALEFSNKDELLDGFSKEDLSIAPEWCGCLDEKLIYILAVQDSNKYEKWVCCHDIKNNKKSLLTKLPDKLASMGDVSYVIYNNSLFVMGGRDYDEDEYLDFMAKYDLVKNEWDTQTYKLPDKMIVDKTVVAGDKLVIVDSYKPDEQSDGERTIHNPIMIFDGKEFKVTDAIPSTSMYTDEEESYVDGVAALGNKIYIIGEMDGYGDTFVYNLATNQFEQTNYLYSNYAKSTHKIFACEVLDDKLFVVGRDMSRIVGGDEELAMFNTTQEVSYIIIGGGPKPTPEPTKAVPTLTPKPTITPAKKVDDGKKVKKVKKPGKVVIKSVSRVKSGKNKNRARLVIKKQKNVGGYQLCYSMSKKFKKAKRYNTTKLLKKSATMYTKKLKKKKYYVKVRAYVISGKKKLYGEFSKIKVIKK